MLRKALLFIPLISWSVHAHCGSLYEDLGGREGIATVVDNFITEISFDPSIYPFFSKTNVPRLREKLEEQFCMLSGGPCEYTGDTMEKVHTGMHISSAEFNRTVELLQSAMDDAGVPFTTQNRLIRLLAPLREEIIRR